MHYSALAADYDGTLALNGIVSAGTVAALQRLRDRGFQLLLVTGREMKELLAIFPKVVLFERVVGENGGLIYNPATGQTCLLTGAPPPRFIDELRRRKVAPMSVGEVIVATWKPHEVAVLETIRDLGLDLQVIFNKDAVMILPAGVNKATGLKAALQELALDPGRVIGVGDAENDLAFLTMCGYSVAVQNALPIVKEKATSVTAGDHGKGVEELIQLVLTDQLPVLSEKT